MMNVTTKQGKQAMVTVDKGAQTAHVTVEGVKYLVAFIRDAKKVVVKNDLLLNESDLRVIKEELAKFIKKTDTTKKGRK